MTAEERRLEAAAARMNAGQRNLQRNIAAQRIDELRKKIRGLRATRNLSRGLIKARTRARIEEVRHKQRELTTSLRNAAKAAQYLAKWVRVGVKLTLPPEQRAALAALAAEHQTYHHATKEELVEELTHRRGMVAPSSPGRAKAGARRVVAREEADFFLAAELEPLEARIFHRLIKAGKKFTASPGRSRLEAVLEYLHGHSEEYTEETRRLEAEHVAELDALEKARWAEEEAELRASGSLDEPLDEPLDDEEAPRPNAWKPTSHHAAQSHNLPLDCTCERTGSGLGWLHMDDSSGRGPGIERCDSCGKYGSDADAARAHARVGCCSLGLAPDPGPSFEELQPREPLDEPGEPVDELGEPYAGLTDEDFADMFHQMGANGQAYWLKRHGDRAYDRAERLAIRAARRASGSSAAEADAYMRGMARKASGIFARIVELKRRRAAEARALKKAQKTGVRMPELEPKRRRAAPKRAQAADDSDVPF